MKWEKKADLIQAFAQRRKRGDVGCIDGGHKREGDGGKTSKEKRRKDHGFSCSVKGNCEKVRGELLYNKGKMSRTSNWWGATKIV